VRIYLPATLDEIGPGLALAERRAHAVTPALRALLPEEDDEGLEYVAQVTAADDAVGLLAVRPGAPRLRVVVAADVPDGEVTEDPAEPPTAVVVAGAVRLAEVVCLLVDEPEAVADVVGAVGGDQAARDRLDERDLLWYDVSEIDAVPRG